MEIKTPTNKDKKSLITRVDYRFFWAIVEKWGRGIFVEDSENYVLLVNQGFCKIFLPEKKPDDLIGGKSLDLITLASQLVSGRQKFLERLGQITKNHERVVDMEVRLNDGRIFEMDCIPVIGPKAEYLGLIWEFHEATTKPEIEEKLVARNNELEKINKVMVGRELRMIELKTELENLRNQKSKK